MAVIKSGASTDELVVDPTSKAARVTLYDKYGNEVNSNKPNKFYLPVTLDVTGNQAANSYIWAMRNGATKKITIEDILLSVGFRGSAAATSQVFELVRFSGANPAGGTAYTLGAAVPKRNSLDADSTIQDARYTGAAALTIGGMSFDPIGIAAMGTVRSVTSQHREFFFRDIDIVLQPNEGLAIRATAATVVGDVILGTVNWVEE